MRCEQAHRLFGGSDLGEWFAHPELCGRAQARAVHGPTVINMRTGRNVRNATTLCEVAHRGEHGPFTEIAAIAGIGSVVWVGVLVGAQYHQLGTDLPGNPVGGGQFGTSQAGRVGDGSQHRAAPERPNGAGQHNSGVDPTGESHYHPTQPTQPVKQGRSNGGGAEHIGAKNIGTVHGAPSSHVRWQPAPCVR